MNGKRKTEKREGDDAWDRRTKENDNSFIQRKRNTERDRWKRESQRKRSWVPVQRNKNRGGDHWAKVNTEMLTSWNRIGS
jgi:hypothetical protein